MSICSSRGHGIGARAILIAALTLLLAGCGASSFGAKTPISATTPISTGGALSAAGGAAAPSFNQPGTDNIGDLLIVAPFGFQCSGWVLLTGSRSSYDESTLTPMRAYIQAVAGNIRGEVGSYDPSEDATYPPRPDTLQVAPGSPPEGACGGQLQVTNAGVQDIQITQVGITYTRASQPNPLSYPLIDRCSIYACQPPCQKGGCGNSYGCLPFADVQLTPSPQGAHRDSPIIIRYAGPAAPAATPCDLYPPLAPGEREDVNVTFTSTAPSQIYDIDLTVTIATSAGSKIITLPRTFDSVFPFAADAQFTCYALHGNTFVVEAQGFSKIDSDLCV